MTAQELLIPRYEIITDYPNNHLDIGTILKETVASHFEYELNGKTFINNI